MSYIPPWQPIRPEGNHRTHIKAPTDTYMPWHIRNIIAQIQLYRWCHSIDYQQQTIIADLCPFLFAFFPQVKKRDMGMTIVQATRYNPRKLKGETLNNPKPASTYLFHDVNDLRYGLEWMICTWLHRAKDTDNPEYILNFLDEMAICDERDVSRLYLEPLGPWRDWFADRTTSWKWTKVWNDFGYSWEHEITAPKIGERPALRRI